MADTNLKKRQMEYIGIGVLVFAALLIGITRFKKSFSGKTVNYPGTYDFIYQPLSYKLYQILRKLNRLLKI